MEKPKIIPAGARPLFQSSAHEKAQHEIAAVCEAAWDVTVHHFPIGSRLDGTFNATFERHRAVVGMGEFKQCGSKFGAREHWAISLHKVEIAKLANQIYLVPVLFVVRFACLTHAWLDAVNEPHEVWKNWGRRDRGSPGDIEDGAAFRLEQFTLLRSAPESKEGDGAIDKGSDLASASESEAKLSDDNGGGGGAVGGLLANDDGAAPESGGGVQAPRGDGERARGQDSGGQDGVLRHSDSGRVVKRHPALCICGARGVFVRRRTDGLGDGFVWRCEVHQSKWPPYAEEM